MSLSTSFFLVVCLFGSCAPQDAQDLILSTLDTLLQKINGLEDKMTSIEESQKTREDRIDQSIKALEERIIGQQGDMTSMKDQLTTFQHLIKHDECEEGIANCSASATCLDAIGQYKCVCIQGYSGDGFTCEDIDECNTNDAICGEGSTCINHPGTYGCLCHEGFREINNFCSDIDECSERSFECGREQTCSNLPGRYTCICPEGYEVPVYESYNCQDINECESGLDLLCSANATCINTEGNYTCKCLSSFYGDGYTCNDCQTELTKAREVLLDSHNIGLDELTPEAEKNLTKSLEQKEPQCRLQNCKNLLDIGKTTSGVYTIYPIGFPDGVEVYCDQETDGGGWTVILQRKKQTPQLSFVKTFEEYANGFGDLNGEMWIGNQVIYALTRNQPFTLRVEVKNLRGRSKSGIWNTFRVRDKYSRFRLSIENYSSRSSLGDALTNRDGNVNRMAFSTYDRDNDAATYRDCVGEHGRGGWWYNACSLATPTAPFGDADGSTQIAYWAFWSRSSWVTPKITALSEIQFKIRPPGK